MARKSINLLDESIDEFQQNFKLIKENKLKLTNISRYLVPKSTTTETNQETLLNKKETKKATTKVASKRKKEKENSSKISKYFQEEKNESIMIVETAAAAVTSKFTCPLCSVDLTAEESEQNRELHVNTCLDRFSKSKNTEQPPPQPRPSEKAPIDKKFADQVRDEGIPNCPICGKILTTLNSHQTHLKKCANEFHIKPDSLVELVKKQRERIHRDLENGFVPSDVHMPSKKAVVKKQQQGKKQPSRIMKLEQPTNQADEELVTAIALSKSLCKEEEQMQIDKCLRITKGRAVVKKTNKDEAIEFLMFDDEDRRRYIEQRLSEILSNQLVIDADTIAKGDSLIRSQFSSENNYLWDKCKYFSQSNDTFYVEMFVKDANFNVGGKLFLDKTQTENKFDNLTFIDTQTAFLLADLNNTTQLGEDINQTVITPFGEILQSQLDEAKEEQRKNVVVEQRESSQSETRVEVDSPPQEETNIDVDEILKELVEEETINKDERPQATTESIEVDSPPQEETNIDVDEILKVLAEEQTTEETGQETSKQRDIEALTIVNDTFEEDRIEVDETLIEGDKTLTSFEIDNKMNDQDDDVILVKSDDDDDEDVIIEEMVGERAFIVEDSIVIEDSSNSSRRSSILPQINLDDDCDSSSSSSSSSTNSSFKRNSKRKSMSLENLSIGSENKLIKLDNDKKISDALGRQLNETSRSEDILRVEDNYDDIWNNFNENQYDDGFNQDFVVNDTILSLNESNSNLPSIKTKTPAKSHSADNSICESFDHHHEPAPSSHTSPPMSQPVVFKTPKVAQIIREDRAANSVVNSPLTPMPNYVTMNTPVLKDELKRYGVKALPRKQAVRKLVEIYEYTHKHKLRKTKSCADLVPQQQQQQEPVEPSTTKSILKPKKPRLKKTVSNIDTVAASAPTTSSRGDDDIAAFEGGDADQMPLSQLSTQTSEEDIKQRIYSYIVNSRELYTKVLNYEPLDFDSLFQQIKNLAEFRIGNTKLMKILDDFCITFTLKSVRSRIKRRKKQH